ncbi:hypothetical protein BDV34DRAFT_193958 [Aspergillus parasiticus]|uniref:Uncharacterized protein n=1 Tax=Aspergillus parasiticus TaxID=5067 RepID=A0A5N6DNF8_ASPPA|nr:hypothetical protein BDV34DRAFT_193958 [Aspergillus parasiticus]
MIHECQLVTLNAIILFFLVLLLLFSFLPLSFPVLVLCTDPDQSLRPCPSVRLSLYFTVFSSVLLLFPAFPCFSSDLSKINFLFSSPLNSENNSLLKEQEMERDVETCRMLASYLRQV